MKSVLLYANDDAGLGARLEAALDVVRAFDGHLTCLTVTPYDAFILGDPFGGIYALPIAIEGLREAEEEHRRRIEQRLAGEGVAWDWVHRDGQPAQMLVNEARLADLVILSQPVRRGGGEASPPALTDAVSVNAFAPVLAVPSGGRGFDCSGAALVAWNGSDEAAHALRFALPLLARASTVNLVVVDGDSELGLPPLDACRYLARHGIKAELHEWRRGQGTTGEALLKAARNLEARYLVLGAYGRSRVMEAMLGGTTRHVLDHAELPLILAH
ncbi:universal stress protein [Allosphingosinicella vermicomposti]|uniref:universal stress protein n=1 Tax=Allosphingosinicella vermicomposti TaxID=614671 RepID=UPI00131A544A|nr:universal stress protein [Allosphingosinicella vermicomposti]